MTTFPNKTHYSAHFSRRELDCHCGCDAPPVVEANLAQLAVSLEALRAALNGAALHVNSGYRCVAYNARIGGAPRSQHMVGKAADLSGRVVKPREIAKAAERVGAFKNGGIGKYGTFCHVDIRSGAARWVG
jgi:uncharacterized protein YcbK (DUF882 family)